MGELRGPESRWTPVQAAVKWAAMSSEVALSVSMLIVAAGALFTQWLMYGRK